MLTGMRRMAVMATAAILAALPSTGVLAQAKQKLTVVVSSATFEPGTATVTSLPDQLGFLAEENIEVELKSARGSALGAQLVMGNQADIVHAGTSVGLMQPVAKGAKLVAYYNMITQNFQMPAVPVDSPIKTLGDLKGKKLGIIGQATATIPIVKAVLEDAGLDPNKDVTFVDVGYGAQAAAALWISKQVDGLAMYDSVYAAIENVDPAKFRLRILTSPLSDKISFQTALVVSQDALKAKRDALIRFGRAHAKSTIFALENPEATIRLHWKKFPEQKPKDGDTPEAMDREKRGLLARLSNMRIDNMAVARDKWGFMHPTDVSTYLEMLQKIGDVEKTVKADALYSNDLIDEINRFDKEAVKKFAREYRVN